MIRGGFSKPNEHLSFFVIDVNEFVVQDTSDTASNKVFID